MHDQHAFGQRHERQKNWKRLREKELGRPILCYEAYTSGSGWTTTYEGEPSGEEHPRQGWEAVKIRFSFPYYSVFYSVYAEGKGWQPEVSDGQATGVQENSQALSGIKIRLDHEGSKGFDLLYRIRGIDGAWSHWRKNGQEASVDGQPFYAMQLALKAHQEEKCTAEEKEFQAFKALFDGFDKDHVWMFDAGNNGRREFRGNPKFLFVYINRYRPDIRAYWFCEKDAEATIEQVRKLNFIGVLGGTPEADYAMEHTGVIVSELVRMYIPAALSNAKYINLWHGIGFKRIERAITLDASDLSLEMAKKYITYHAYFRDNQMLTVTSPLYEKEFLQDFGLERDHLIRTGYLRCMYQSKYDPIHTFAADLQNIKGLPQGTSIAVYAPSYRAQRGNAFASAISDLEALHQCCENNHILLVFKVHPYIEKEVGFLNAWKQYGEHPYFWFWDNANDFYEILDLVDLVIYDYSSIFSDFLCAGVKHYIRYIYDEEEYMVDGLTQGREAYNERTCGAICRTFSELLHALAHYRERDDAREAKEIYQKLWAYAGEDDFEKTIQAVMDFRVRKRVHPTLYSFDVFDTLISRKGLHPYSIFYAVRERMHGHGFSPDFIERYPALRHAAEMNVREYHRKTTDVRQSEKVEITMPEIFARLRDVYALTEEQAASLMAWEIEEELQAVIPLPGQISLAKQYRDAGNAVILLSDMYLPKDAVLRMLQKADPALAELPLFLSSEYGVQKTTKRLYFEAYKSFKPLYRFGRWIHYGDTPNADQRPARQMGIQSRLVQKPSFNALENALVEALQNADGYLVAAMQARMREIASTAAEAFVIDIVGLALIPYVDWVIRDAREKGFQTLYFVSRDGHHLKRIADALIDAYQWNIKTKYIYASRRTWRIPSYIDRIDDIFWVPQGGNFNDIRSKEELFRAMGLDESTFHHLLPQIDLDGTDWAQDQPGRALAPMLKCSAEYQRYLLQKAAEERPIVCAYLAQEINASEKFAVVEYWGRGYNQECMSRLWDHIQQESRCSHYYYARSILPTEGKCMRYNFTSKETSLIFMEAIFANMPYHTVEEYEEKDGKLVPVLVPMPYDQALYDAMECLLPRMARQYAMLPIKDHEPIDRKLYDFLLRYVDEHRDSPFLAEHIGRLKDSPTIYGKRKEYAPAYTAEDLEALRDGRGRGVGTSSVAMSYARANDAFKKEYDAMYQHESGDDPASGSPLKAQEITKNLNYKTAYERADERAKNAARQYEEFCQAQKVWQKVCVVTAYKDFTSDAMRMLSRWLNAQENIYVEWICASRDAKEDGEMMQQLATARYILMEGNAPQLLRLSLRPETTGIALLDRGFHLYRFGHSLRPKLKWHERYEKLLYSLPASIIEHTGQTGAEIKAYDLSGDAVMYLPGAAITDVLFDEEFRQEALQAMHEAFPASMGKKIIAYLPTPRKRWKSQAWLEILDIERLADLLGEEYVIALDFRNNERLVQSCKNVIEVDGFSKDMSRSGMSLRSLLVASDVVLGDYRDTFFESVLLKKPVFSTACDAARMQENTLNMNYDLSEMYPFPIVGSAEDLAEKLSDLGAYDYAPLDEFRNKYLIGCDGQAAKRLVEYLCESHAQVF